MPNKTRRNKKSKSKKNNKTLKKAGFIKIPYMGIMKRRDPNRDPNRDNYKAVLFDIIKIHLLVTGSLPTKITQEEIDTLNRRPELIKLFTNQKTNNIRFNDSNMLNNLNKIFEEKKIEKGNNFNNYLCDSLNIPYEDKKKCKKGIATQHNIFNQLNEGKINSVNYEIINKIILGVLEYIKYLNDYNKERKYSSLQEIFSDRGIDDLYKLNIKYKNAILPVNAKTNSYFFIDTNGVIKIRPEILDVIRNVISQNKKEICSEIYHPDYDRGDYNTCIG